MKITHILAAAGLAITALGAAAPASAQNWRDHRGDDRGRYDRHDDRGRHNGWDRGRGHGWNHGPRCHTEWRHHHRVRICR